MIAGNAAENLLFVVETQRKGEAAIKGAREDVAALGLEVEKMSATSRAALDAMTPAEQRAYAGFVQGQHAAKGLTTELKAGQAPARELGSVYDRLTRSVYASAYAMDAEINAGQKTAAQLAGIGKSADAMSPKVKTSASAMSTLALSTAGFTSGGTAAIMAAGNLATSVAALSSSAAVAASATGIGALAIVLGTVITLLKSANAEAADLSATMDVIHTVTGAAEALAVSQSIDRELAEAQAKLVQWKKEHPFAIISVAPEAKQIQAEITGLEKASQAAFRSYADMLGREGQRAGEQYTARAKAEADRRRKEAEDRLKHDAETALNTQRRLSVSVLDLEEARDNDIYTQRRLKIERAYGDEIAKLKELQISDSRRLAIQQQAFQVRQRSLEALAEEQRLLREAFARETQMINATAAGNVAEQYDARIREIEAMAAAELKAGQRAVDVEARKQARIRELRQDTYRAAMASAKQLEDVLIGSNNRQVKAIGQAFHVVRRIVLGFEAADATVKGLKEGAAAIAAAASFRWAQAAQHAAAAIEYARVASVAASEAGGGGSRGGGAGSAGGAAGGSQSEPAFEPRTAANSAGSLNLTLITRNPYGRDQIQNVAYELNRSGVLKRPPIEIPPTNGITRVA